MFVGTVPSTNSPHGGQMCKFTTLEYPIGLPVLYPHTDTPDRSIQCGGVVTFGEKDLVEPEYGYYAYNTHICYLNKQGSNWGINWIHVDGSGDHSGDVSTPYFLKVPHLPKSLFSGC